MKHSRTSVLIIASCSISIFFAVTYVSCRKDRCATIQCANEGECRGGICWCPVGYEGATCDSITRNKFLGNWNASQSNEIKVDYIVNIAESYPVNRVYINNFNNSFTKPLVAYTSGEDSLIISRQALQGKIVEGACYYAGPNDLRVHYSSTDSATNTVVSVVTTWN